MSEAGIEQEALEHSHMCAVEEVEVEVVEKREVVEVMGGVEEVDMEVVETREVVEVVGGVEAVGAVGLV